MVGKSRQATGERNARRLYPERWNGVECALRAMPGEENPAARLTEDDVRALRLAYANGETQTSIGRRLGVSQVHISRIISRKSWPHVN